MAILHKLAKLTIVLALMCIVLPLLAAVLLSTTTYISDGLIAILPFDQVASAKIFFAIRAIITAVVICLVYYYLSDFFNQKINGNQTQGLINQEKIQPWLFIMPAAILLLLFLIIPSFQTLFLSFTTETTQVISDASSSNNQNQALTSTTREFIGFQNYEFLFATDDFWFAIRNSLLWLLVVPTCCIVFGLSIAALADNLSWGRVAKSLIFVPLAISFVGAAVIWRNIYASGGAGGYQTGLLNALLAPFSVEPRFWYETEFWGNFFLMSIFVWIQTGFAMILLSAALAGVSEETKEAARMDGANELQVFFKITLPQIYGTIFLVWTTLIIMVLKVFDIPYALTANKSDKLLLATLMEQLRTAQREEELAAAVAVILIIVILPIMIINGWRGLKGDKV